MKIRFTATVDAQTDSGRVSFSEGQVYDLNPEGGLLDTLLQRGLVVPVETVSRRKPARTRKSA